MIHSSSTRSTPLFLVLFFISGGCALIYEVVWTRLFTVVIGNTVFSNSAILIVFMAGLALGAGLAGRIIDRKSVPLVRAYAVLEAAIALYNLSLPFMLKAIDPAFGFIYANAYHSPAILALARLGISFALLIVPATLMGATLPILIRFYVANIAEAGAETGRVYSANTLGAAAGAAVAGFVLIPLSGVTFALGLAAALNLGIATIAWIFGRNEKPSPARNSETEGSAAGPRTVLVAMFLSGMAALINEVAWTRVLGLVIGPTTYAFTLMLCSMITGLGLGAAIASLLMRRYTIDLSTFAWIHAGISLASLALVPAFGRLPLWIARLVMRHMESFTTLQILELLVMFGLMLVPTTLLGMTFPIASKLYARSDSLLGSEIGAVYVFNTAGGIAGALLGGFVLIPSIGSQTTLIVAALVSAAAALVLIRRSSWRPALVGIPVVAAAFMIPSWNPELMASGAYKYAPYLSRLDLESVLTSGDLLYYNEGTTTTVSAKKYRGTVSLSIDGKVDATDSADMLTQKMLGHLPLMLSENPETVAIIGLGSGVTAAAALMHPIKKLDIVEISPEVVEASRFFSHVNRDALMDPRTELIIGDGRNHLRYAQRSYDVIISEPSNPWMAGMASLFTREFFTTAQSRLSEDGIFCQWLHSYNMSTADLQTIAATFRTVFPHATLWTLNENDFLLLGSRGMHNTDESRLQEKFERVAEDLRHVQVQDLYSIASLLMLRDEEVDRFAGSATVNTDDWPVLEFRAPRFIYSDTAGENFALVSQVARTVERDATAENHRNKGEMYLAAEAFKEAREEFHRSLRKNVHDARAWKGLVDTARGGFGRAELKSFFEETLGKRPNTISRMAAADFFEQENAHARSVEVLATVLKDEPDNLQALEKMTEALAPLDGVRLQEIIERVLALDPQNSKALYHLATIRMRQGRVDEASQLVKRSLEREPANAQSRTLLAIIYGQTFQPALAEAEFQRAIEQAPEDSASYSNYGIFLLERHKPADARIQFERAISVNPEDPSGFVGVGEAYRQEGDMRKAGNWYRKARLLDPDHPVARQYGDK